MSQETVVKKHDMVLALERLNEFDVEDFYACDISFGQTKLQGHATRTSVQKYMALGYVFEVTESWLHSTKDGVRITLTYQF
jgi:hypothetical protein